MGYKQIDQNMTYAEVSLLKSMEHNRNLKKLENINQVINWSQVEEILMSHYTVGTSRDNPLSVYVENFTARKTIFIEQMLYSELVKGTEMVIRVKAATAFLAFCERHS